MLEYICFTKDEPANIYVIYHSKIRQSNHHRYPGLTYLNQVSKYLSTDKTVRFSAEEIANYAKDKHGWNMSITAHELPNDDDDDLNTVTSCALQLVVSTQFAANFNVPVARYCDKN